MIKIRKGYEFAFYSGEVNPRSRQDRDVGVVDGGIYCTYHVGARHAVPTERVLRVVAIKPFG